MNEENNHDKKNIEKTNDRVSNHVHDIPPRATWREWTGLVALMFPVFMLATDLSALFLAMPAISADLAPSSSQMLWILHIGEFLAIGFVLTMGRLGDRIGRRKLLVIGVSIYGAASFIAAFSTSAEMLITMRALLGIAAASVMPSTMSLLRSMFADQKQFSIAIAVNLSAFSAGGALGSPLAGILLEYFWWGSVFIINVPAAFILVILAWILPTYRDPNAKRLDMISIVLSILAIICFVYGVQEFAENGFHILYIGFIGAGTMMAIAFVRRQLQLDDPLLDMSLFYSNPLKISLISSMLILFVVVGTDMLFAQYLQTVMGLSSSQAGLLLIIPAVLAVAGTLLAPVLTRWLRPANAMGISLFGGVVGSLIVVAGAHIGHIGLLMIGVSLISLGVGPAMTLCSELVVSNAPIERTGSASAITDVSAGLGQGLGIALLGSLAMLVYRWTMMNSVSSDVPIDAMQTSQDSVSVAIEVAKQLPNEVGDQLIQAANASFTLGIQLTFTVASVVLFGVAIMVMWRLRDVRSDTSE